MIAKLRAKETAMSSISETAISPRDLERNSELEKIREALQGLRFGSVSIIVQDGVVVQIDRTEKNRLQRRNVPDGTACS